MRLPSALAGSLLVALVVGLATKRHGVRRGLIAGALLAVMPLHVAVSRLTLTDGLLALWWFATLACGCLAVTEPSRRRWPVLLWLAVALGWLTKGPLILLPLAILAAWLIVGRRAGDLRKLRPVPGLALSLVPIGVWAVLVLLTHEQAAGVGKAEVLVRAAGGGAHAKPFWYFLPIFLVGLFPATAMMDLPGLNHRASHTMRLIRIGHERALWLWAVVLPLIVFSIPSGKLPTYILPAAPALAMLVAPVIERWLTADRPSRPLPDVRITLFVVVLGASVGGFVAAGWLLGRDWLWLGLPALLVLAAAGHALVIWTDQPRRRRAALTALWASVVLLWVWGDFASTIVLRRYDTPKLLARIHAVTDLPAPRLAAFDHEDESLSFYSGRFVPRIDGAEAVADLADRYVRDLVIVAEAPDWDAMAAEHPEVADRFDELFTWPTWPGDEVRSVHRLR